MIKNRLVLLMLFLSIVSPGIVPAQTVIQGGAVSGEWNRAGSPYLVLDNVRIPEDFVLKIGPGVTVEFQGNFGMIVEGILLAEGVPGDSVYFSVSDTTGFSDTTVTWGGWAGIGFMERLNSDSSVLDHCVISFGKANGAGEPDKLGGGVCARGYSSLVIRNCHVHHNLARLDGGGIGYMDHCTVSIEHCDISYNTAFRYGGGIYNGAGCDALVRNNRIHHNAAILKRVHPPYISFSGCGGGFYASNGNPVVINNYICNNNAVSGGGLYESSVGITVAGNVICNNGGPGIFNGHSLGEGTYANNTICGNTRAGGIVSNSWRLYITGNILWNNINDANPGAQLETDYGSPEVTFCNIQNGFPGEGNINAIPFFSDPTPGAGVTFNAMSADWQLQEISPCINAGEHDTTWLGLDAEDIEGNPRVFGDRIEMGAYEDQSMTVGINEDADMPVTVKVFPNPTTGPIQFAFYKLLEGNVYIFSMSGQVVLIDHINRDKDRSFDLTGLPAGTYFWRIDDVSETYQGKIVIER